MSIKVVGSGLRRHQIVRLKRVRSSIILITGLTLWLIGVSVIWDVGMIGSGPSRVSGQSSIPEQEPNETVADANQITIPGQRTGVVKYGDPAVIEFTYNNGPKDRIEDLYSFTLPGVTAQRVDIQLSFTTAAADLDLVLYQKESTGVLRALAVSSGSTTVERITPETPLSAGDYLIGVTAFDSPDNTAQTAYTLLLTGETTAVPPIIGSINPVSVGAGSGPFSLVVNGTNFYAGQSAVRWNDEARPTTYIHGEQLVAFLTAADIASPGMASVTVVNPVNLGGTSRPVSFQILPEGVPETEVEPNETSGQAGVLGIPGKRSGTVAVGDAAAVTLTMITGQGDPVEDLFAVNLMESRRLDLRLTGSNTSADLALYLLQEREIPGQYTVLGNSRLKGSVQQITTSIALPSGRYLVGVSAVTGQSSYVVELNLSGDRRLQLNAASAAPGSPVSVPITYASQGTENQMTFSLAYDPTRMSNATFVTGTALVGAQVRVDRSEVTLGRLGMEIRLPEGKALPSGLVEIGRVDLQLAAGSSFRSSRIEFADRPIVRTLVDRNNTALIGSYEGGNVLAIPGFEADLMPRPYGNGDGRVTIADWTQTGRFVANIDAVTDGSEFQRADSAPRTTNGDGRLTVADWVLAGRYAAGLDQPAPAGGPSAPAQAATASGPAVKIYQHSSFTESLSSVHDAAGIDQEARTVRVRPDLFSRGRENELIIELVSRGDENALGFSLVFDTSQMSYLRALPGTDASGGILNVNTSQLAQGRVGVGLALPTSQSFPSGVRQIVRLVFNVPNGGTVNTTTIGFIDQPIMREVVDPAANILQANYVAGEVRLDPPADLLPTLSNVDPSTLSAGGTKTSVTVRGTNFVNGAIGLIGGADRPTTFVSTTELRVEVQSEDLIESGTLEIQVRNPPPGGGLSNKVTVAVVNPVPFIESLSPEVAGVGGASFTLTVNGQNFVPGSEIEFNGRRRVATWFSGTRLATQITAADTPTVGTVIVRVINPEPGGGVSNQVNFTVRPLNPLPRVASVSPSSVEQGVSSQTVVITGTNFVEGSTVVIGSERLPATYVSATELRLTIDGTRFRTTGSVLLLVNNPAPGGGNSNWIRLLIVPPRNPAPVLTGISPSTVFAGGQPVTLTLTGTNFVPSSQVQANGEVLPSVFVSSSLLTVQIGADLIISADTLAIRVVNPEPGGGASTALTLNVINPQPVLTSITPDNALTGGPSFTLSLTGGGFVPESRVVIDGLARTTGYVSATRLTVQIKSSEIATMRTISIQVVNPTPGGGSSRVLNLGVREPNPIPRMAAVRPSEVRAGGPGFILTVEGSRFVPESIIRIDNRPRETDFVSDSVLATRIDSSEIITPKELTVSVANPAPGGGQSSSFTLRVVNPVPLITTINPTRTPAGGPDLDLVIFGEGFVSTSRVSFNTVTLAATVVTGSQLRVAIPAALIAGGGVAKIGVSNPSPGGGSSNLVNLTVENPIPTVGRLTPATVVAGAGGTDLIVEGSGFIQSSVLVINGQNRPATLISGNRLSTTLSPSDILTAGVFSVSVFNPEPLGGLSTSLQLTVQNPVPKLTSLSQTSIVVGSAATRLTLNGQGFVPGSVVQWNGVARPTIFVTDKLLMIDLLPSDLAAVATVTMTVTSPTPGGGISTPIVLSITPQPNPIPVIDRITPATAVAGSADTLVTINGSGFISGSTVHWAGSPRSTTLIGPTQLTVRLSAADLMAPGSFNIMVVTGAPGGGTSNQQIFQVTSAVSNCQTVCFESASYFLENLDKLPTGAIWIHGSFYDVAGTVPLIREVLSADDTQVNRLAREFTAAQLSLLRTRNQLGALNSKLDCYNKSFYPIMLSNGAIISTQTLLGQLFIRTRVAITSEIDEDIQALQEVFNLLSKQSQSNLCR